MGTALQAVGYATFLALLTRADLGVVVPTGAGSYVLITLLSRWVLREVVPPQRWMGVLLVTLGVALVLSGRSARSSVAAGPGPAGAVAARAQPEARGLAELAGRSAG